MQVKTDGVLPLVSLKFFGGGRVGSKVRMVVMEPFSYASVWSAREHTAVGTEEVRLESRGPLLALYLWL